MTTFAAIDVGSSGLSMKIFELSKQTGIREITHIRHKILLGSETYHNGMISHKSIMELCTVLKDFSRIMAEYDSSAYSAYATSALREAKNNPLILDQIRFQTGLNVKILSNSEQRLLRYKAIALKEPEFDTLVDQGALIVDSGAGSVQFSLFEKGTLAFTKNLRLGFARLHEKLHELEPEAYNYADLIAEYIEKDLSTLFHVYLEDKDIKHIIAAGDLIQDLRNLFFNKKSENSGFLTAKEFRKVKLPPEMAALLLPLTVLYDRIFTLTKSMDLYLSEIDFCDSMVAEYAEKRARLPASKRGNATHDFPGDMISAAFYLAKRYQVSFYHIENVKYLAMEIFDRIRKPYGMGTRERLLLQIGTILHSCGAFIDINETRENSYRIIMATELIGLSKNEQIMVANMVRYNSKHFPEYELLAADLDKEQYITTLKLCAILKIANILDKSHQQKICSVRVTLKEDELLIVASSTKDITLEMGLFQSKADIFEETFGIRPRLKLKRG
ncbi:MAG: exopolyphosphatase, partial [Lachnoclostridium sp.]|nr:exopolyphosphatase [Lachnoclostridium sp.]